MKILHDGAPYQVIDPVLDFVVQCVQKREGGREAIERHSRLYTCAAATSRVLCLHTAHHSHIS